MTQQQLSTLLGKPQSYVSKYESGERRVDFVEVEDICDALGLSLGQFVITYQKKGMAIQPDYYKHAQPAHYCIHESNPAHNKNPEAK